MKLRRRPNDVTPAQVEGYDFLVQLVMGANVFVWTRIIETASFDAIRLESNYSNFSRQRLTLNDVRPARLSLENPCKTQKM